ncbi:hypothetical protein [Salinibius halmophilus]|uniref:hypothetical protein n=1 Tax=Salinibius halmophilus TaxID=1853216 RepID=UPI000E66BF2D|nr:hypothetical protein [Salinibius halmophilus]
MNDIPIWQYVLSMGGYIVLLLALVEVMRKKPWFALVFWLLSLLSFPFWFEYLDGWFRWAKTLSVLLPTALVVGFARIAWLYKDNPHKFLAFFRGDWVLMFLYGILFLNIAEATLKDFATANYFNAICGVILCITIPFPRYKNGERVYWVIGKEAPNDLLFYSTAAWNFLYTTWNMAFVYGEAGPYFAASMCILIAAELYPILKRRPELYIIARVYTLAFHILVRSVSEVFVPLMDSSSWMNAQVLWVWGLINLVLHVPFLVWYFWRKRNSPTQEPPFGETPPPSVRDYPPQTIRSTA